MKDRGKQLAALFLALSLLLTACGGGKAAAATMHLVKTEGKVTVDDAEGKSVQLMDNLGLFSGYGVDTRSESYAWINLDEVKLTKMDQDSEVEIRKDGKKLEIEVLSGSLFFHVTEPLEADETMEICASTMLVGIRGTCGWVTLSEEGDRLSVYLLEGKVRCEADGEKETVRAGEMAVMTEDGEITVEEFSAADVPAFVLEEIEDDDDLMEAILGDSGIDTSGSLRRVYPDVFAEIEQNGESVLFAEEFDFEADNSPELLVFYTDEGQIRGRFYRKGTEQSQFLGPAGYISDLNIDEVWKFSLVESGGRLFVFEYVDYGTNGRKGNWYDYYGSTAQNDGDSSHWGQVERVTRYRANASIPFKYERDGLSENGLRIGANEPSTLEEYEAVIAQYKELKVLVCYTSDGGYVVLPDPSEIEEPPISTEPEPDVPSTDGDRLVLQGTVNTYSGAELLGIQGQQDPNPGPWSESGNTFRVIMLDPAQSVTARSGDGQGSYSGEAMMIDVTHAQGLEQYDGQHVTFSIDPNNTWWPSDTSLPLGQPRTDDVHVLG